MKGSGESMLVKPATADVVRSWRTGLRWFVQEEKQQVRGSRPLVVQREHFHASSIHCAPVVQG